MKYPTVNALQRPMPRMTFATLSSIGLHVFLLFGIALSIPNWKNIPIVSQPLEVTGRSAKRKSPENRAFSSVRWLVAASVLLVHHEQDRYDCDDNAE